MATSGSTNYTVTRSDLIDHAFRLLSVYGEDESVSTEDTNLAATSLNLMIKSWLNQGIHLWTETEATGVLTKDIPSYLISSSTGRFSNAVVETSLSAAEAASQTILSVTDPQNIAASDTIGILLDDGTIDWTTVASTTSTTVTVDDALTGAAASGNRVYAYTSRINRPTDISQIRVRNDSDTDQELRRISRKEYYAISDKYSSGVPQVYYYDPQLSGGVLNVWPAPENAKLRLKMTYQRTLEDMDAAADNLDFPIEWAETIAYNLAVRLASIKDREEKLQVVGPIAGQLLEAAKSYDNEKASLKIHPATDWTR